MVLRSQARAPGARLFSRLKFDESQRPSRRSIKAAMSLAPLCPPIKFQQLSAEVFILWIMSMKKSDGEFHVISTYMNHRSALFNLFRDYHEVMSTELNGEIGNHFIGLRRMIVDKVSSGDGSIKVGKDPLTFGLYQYVFLSSYAHKSQSGVRVCPSLHGDQLEPDVPRSQHCIDLCESFGVEGRCPLCVLCTYEENETIVQTIVAALRDEVRSISGRSDVVMEERFAVAMVDRLIEQGVIAPPVPTSVAASTEESAPLETLTEELPADETPTRLFTWGGGIHYVPEDFKLQSVPTETMWYRWCCGDPSALLSDGEIIKVPPFRTLNRETSTSQTKENASAI